MGENVKACYEAPSHTYAPGDKYSLILSGLPDKHRVPAIGIEVVATVANSAAGAVVVYPRQLARLFANALLDSPLAKVHTTGRMLWALYKAIHGKSLSNGGVSIAGAGGTATVRCRLKIPFSHPRSASQHDTAQDCELLKKAKEIEIALDASNIIGTGGAGTQTVTSAQIRHYFDLIDEAGQNATPSEVEINYVAWSQQNAFLKGERSISDLLLYDEGDDIVTLTEYDHMTLKADGFEVYNNLPTSQLVHTYNDRVVPGGTQDNEVEQLPTEGNLLFLPLYSAPWGFKSTQLLAASDQLETLFTGTANAQRLAYFAFNHTSESRASEAAALKGINVAASQVESRTIKGNVLSGDPRRVVKNLKLLPKRWTPRA